MSDAMLVFVKGDQLPTVNGFIAAVKEEGFPIELESWENDDLTEVDGYWPANLNGHDSGAEFYLGEAADDDLESWGLTRDELGGRDFVAEIVFYDNESIAVSAALTAVLCKRCDGLAFGDDDQLSVNRENCMAWAKEINNLMDHSR